MQQASLATSDAYRSRVRRPWVDPRLRRDYFVRRAGAADNAAVARAVRLRESLWPSASPVLYWCGVLLRVDAARVRFEDRIAEEIADESVRTPDAGPAVIPEE